MDTYSVSSSQSIDTRMLDLQENQKINVKMLPSFESEFPRIKNHSAISYQDKIYIFGGYNGQKNLNKLHIFDPQAITWQIEKFTNNSDLPEGRNGHAAVVIANKMYVIGGWIGKGFYASSQLYILDLDTLNWTQMQTQGTEPGPCNMHTAEHYKGKIYVYRGGDGKCYLSDLHSLDVETFRWEKVVTKGEYPPERANHACTIVNELMYIFGGWDGVKRLNDLYCLELRTFEWRKINSNAWKVVPPPRAGMKMLNVEGSLYIFGGSGPSSTCYNDLWFYEPSKNAWFQCKVAIEGNHILEANDQSGEQGKEKEQMRVNKNFSQDSSEGMKGVSDNSLNNYLNPRSGHSMTLFKNMLFIVGGSWGPNYYKNYIVLDIDPKPEIHSKFDESFSNCGFLSNLKQFYNNPLHSDVIFSIQGEQVYGHKIILSLMGESFNAMFSVGMRESHKNIIEINTVDAHVFKIILKSLYSNNLELNEEEATELDMLFELYRCCDLYLIEKMMVVVLQRIKDLITVDNVHQVLKMANQHNSIFLLNYCLWFQRRHKAQINLCKSAFSI